MMNADKNPVVGAITQHALERFMERSGSKKMPRAIGQLFCLAESAVSIGNNRFYARGWIVVVLEGEVKTAYRPRTREQQEAIFRAMSAKPAGRGQL